MNALLSIEVVVSILDRSCFSYFNFEHNHISIRFGYNVHDMIGNNCDMVNCYGFMSHMAFDQLEYSLDYFQYDSVQHTQIVNGFNS
jgi:hypothetical protein